VCGPDRVGILSQVSRIIGENDGKMHETRATSLRGTFSMMADVEVQKDSAELSFALQTQLGDYVTCIRPEGETEAESKIFGRLDLKKFTALSVINLVTENFSSRSIDIATLRTSEHKEGYYSATISLASSGQVDFDWLEAETAELSDKFNVDLEFKRLNPDTN